MDFKPGDKIVCVQPDGLPKGVLKGQLYLFEYYSKEFPDLIKVKGNSYFYVGRRFVLANDFSELEYIIYGVIK